MGRYTMQSNEKHKAYPSKEKSQLSFKYGLNPKFNRYCKDYSLSYLRNLHTIIFIDNQWKINTYIFLYI